MSEDEVAAGHVFLSYVREDSQAVDQLQRVLEAAGIPVWRDTANLWPGEDWRDRIRRAITDDSLVFIVCFSENSLKREKSYQNEELILAIEQLRQRRPDHPWLIPVRFDDCTIPDLNIGGSRTLALIQRADLFGPDEHESAERLVAAVLRILGRRSDAVASAQARLGTQVAGTAVNLGARNEPQNVVTGQPSRAASSVTSGAAPDVTPMNGLAGTDRGLIDRWRLTHTLVDASAMAQLEHQGFGHRAYSRPLEQTPPWVRIRAVVACDYLGEIPGWQELRGRFAGFLSQESIRGLIYELADITDGSAWRQRGTQRRSWLEADLTLEDEAVPAASAILFLPERDIQGRLQHGCAELTLHVDFAPRSPAGISEELLARRPQYWRERFAQALALPGELADFLERQFGLAVSGEPAGQFGIRLQARQTMAEMVDVSGIKALPAQYAMNHFTGWAVAEPTGKTTQELAPQMMLDLSERVLHLDGSVQEMSGLP